MGEAMLGVDITKVKTSAEGPEWPLGTLWTDPLTGNAYRYINADTAITAHQFATPTYADTDAPWSCVPCGAVALTIEGVAIVDIANEGFGWVQIRGKHLLANIADAVVAGDMLGTTATAGRLDAITFTTTAATLNQLTAGYNALRGVRVLPLTDGTAGNTATVQLF